MRDLNFWLAGAVSRSPPITAYFSGAGRVAAARRAAAALASAAACPWTFVAVAAAAACDSRSS